MRGQRDDGWFPLERHGITSAPLKDPGGDCSLPPPHRVQGDDRALDVQHVEPFRDRRDLVGFISDLALAEHQPSIIGSGTDNVKRRLDRVSPRGVGAAS